MEPLEVAIFMVGSLALVVNFAISVKLWDFVLPEHEKERASTLSSRLAAGAPPQRFLSQKGQRLKWWVTGSAILCVLSYGLLVLDAFL